MSKIRSRHSKTTLEEGKLMSEDDYSEEVGCCKTCSDEEKENEVDGLESTGLSRLLMLFLQLPKMLLV